MAKKLNKNLVGGLVLFGMILIAVAGFILLQNLPGQDPTVYEADAVKFEEEGQYELAVDMFQRAYLKDPAKNPEYLVRAARCAIEAGHVAGARELLTRANVRDANLKSALELSTKLQLELAGVAGGSQQWNRCLEEAQKLLNVEPESSLGLHALGESYVKLQAEDSSYAAKGEAALKRALELDPTNTDVASLVTQILWTSAQEKEQAGELDEADSMRSAVNSVLDSAIAACGEAGKESEVIQLKQLKALFEIQSDEVEKGMAALEALAKSATDTADCHLALARIYAGGLVPGVPRDLEKAKGFLKRGLEIDSKNPRLYNLLAGVLNTQAAGEEDEAKRDELLAERVSVLNKALDEIEFGSHFRQYQDNQFRVEFLSDLFDNELSRLTSAKSDEERDSVLADAESWIARLADEVTPESTDLRLLRARLYNAKGDYIAATKEAEAAERVAGRQNRVKLHRLLAELYMRQQQWGASKRSLVEAIRSQPTAPSLRIAMGRVCLELNQAAEALEYLTPPEPQSLRDALMNDPEAIKLCMEAYRRLNQPGKINELAKKLPKESLEDQIRPALILILEEKYSEAEKQLLALLDAHPGEQVILDPLMRLYSIAGRLDQGRTLVARLRQEDPDNRQYQRYELMLMEGNEEDKEARYLEFLKDEKDPFTRNLSLAQFYYSKNKIKEAIKALDEAERLQRDNPTVIERQFRIALNEKDWDRAEKYTLRYGELNIDGADGNVAQGRLAIARGQFEQAIALIKTGLQKYPSNSLGWTYLAEAYQGANRVADAKSVLVRALEIDPTNGFANRMMASIALRENDEEAAGRYLDAAARALPNDTWVQRQLNLLAERENPTTGISRREAIRKETPDDTENLVLLARLYADARVGQYDKAAEAYQAAFKLSSNDLALAREIAMFYGREEVNRPDEGEELLRNLLQEQKSESDKAVVAVLLGRFFESQRAAATADRYFRMAVSFDPSPEVLLEAAQFYTRVNQLRTSLEYYQRVRENPGDNQETARNARLRSIGLLLALGDLDEAKGEVESYVGEYPDDAQGLIYLGAYHRIGGDIQKAKQAFDSHLERDPDNAAALWQRGQMYVLMGKWQLAISDLGRAKSFRPDGFLYQHRIALANALLETGREEEAITELRSIIEDHPDETSVAEALLELYMQANPPRYSDAENLAYRYMRRYPKDPRWPIFIGDLGKRAQNWEKAISGYETAAEVSMQRPDCVISLLDAYRKAGKPREIITYVTDKLSARLAGSSSDILCALGWAYVQTNDMDRGLEVYDQALAAAAGDFIAFGRTIGETVSVLGKERALQRVEARVESDPTDLDGKKGMVHLLYLNNRMDDALAAAEELSKLASRDEDIVFAELAQGMLLAQNQEHEKAKPHYEKVLKVNPNQPMALNNLAFLLAEDLHNPAEALPYAEQAKRLNPNSADVLDTLGWVLHLNGKDGEAVGMLLRALEIDRDNAVVNYHLGVVHRARGENEEAKFRLELAKEKAEAQGERRVLPKINKELEELAGGTP